MKRIFSFMLILTLGLLILTAGGKPDAISATDGENEAVKALVVREVQLEGFGEATNIE